MRISDGISDGCSSDLVGTHQHRRHQAKRAKALRDRIRLDVAVIILGGPDELARPFQRRCDHVVDEAVFIDDVRLLELVGEFGVEHLLEQVLEAAVIGLQDRVLGGKIDRPAAIEARSEEHTSELQSLMRISYAVFCLKQKKKQTEIKK